MIAAYKLSISGQGVVRTIDGAHIPADTANADWRDYQAWLGAGNTPDAAYSTAELRLKKKIDAGAEYDRRIAAGRTYTQGQVTATAQISESAQKDITAEGAAAKFVLLGQGSWSGQFAWRMADNSFLPMTAAQMSAFSDNVRAYVELLDFAYWTHVDSLTNPQSQTYVADGAVAAYDVTQGWPAN